MYRSLTQMVLHTFDSLDHVTKVERLPTHCSPKLISFSMFQSYIKSIPFFGAKKEHSSTYHIQQGELR